MDTDMPLPLPAELVEAPPAEAPAAPMEAPAPMPVELAEPAPVVDPGLIAAVSAVDPMLGMALSLVAGLLSGWFAKAAHKRSQRKR